jgi:hypothetical protein
MEDVGIFYEHLVYFTVFCYILWTFGIVRFLYFFPFWYFVPRKIWQPCSSRQIMNARAKRSDVVIAKFLLKSYFILTTY